MHTADELRRFLNLRPHLEGGFFVETYRSAHLLPADSLPAGYTGPRAAGTAIYYLLTPDSFSAMHRLPGDEIFHFYLGDPVEMLQLAPDGSGRVIALGSDVLAGMRPQVVVPGGVWQGSLLVAGGTFALLGATMAPGFDYADYEAGSRDDLQSRYPQFRTLIAELTRD